MTTGQQGLDVGVDAAAYHAIRRNVADLLAGRPEAAERDVPASPGWTVRDVVVHLVEIAWRVLGRLTRKPGELRFRTASAGIDELLAEWDRIGVVLDPLVDGSATVPDRKLLMDAFTHEWDLRRALGGDVPADHPAYPNALDLVATGFSVSVREHRLPALRIQTGGLRWSAGDGQLVARLSAHRNDLYRSLTGRRTHAQIASLAWSTEPTPWLPAFEWGPFRPPDRPTEDIIA
jgi:uncharacterized protein (TIGR03083 family)